MGWEQEEAAYLSDCSTDAAPRATRRESSAASSGLAAAQSCKREREREGEKRLKRAEHEWAGAWQVWQLLTPFVKNDDTKLSHAICFDHAVQARPVRNDVGVAVGRMNQRLWQQQQLGCNSVARNSKEQVNSSVGSSVGLARSWPAMPAPAPPLLLFAIKCAKFTSYFSNDTSQDKCATVSTPTHTPAHIHTNTLKPRQAAACASLLPQQSDSLTWLLAVARPS